MYLQTRRVRPCGSRDGSRISAHGKLYVQAIILWLAFALVARDARAQEPCDLCAQNWLFILGAGGRTGSTTALSMFRLVPHVELTGEHQGVLNGQYEMYKRLAKMRHTSVASAGPRLDMDGFRCVTQELVRVMVFGKRRASEQSQTRIVGFKEIAYTSWHMLSFLKFTFPCSRWIFSVREKLDVPVKSNFNATRLRLEWGKQRLLADCVHKAFPNTIFRLAVEQLSVQVYNDALHHLLGVRNCSFKGILSANLDGKFSREPDTEALREKQTERARREYIDGDCDLSNVSFRLSSEHLEQNRVLWYALNAEYQSRLRNQT
ncbi:hypothetical protein FVE85_2168 [Porphyridium purpureum]|uniref:Protein-tyrosine sulfotransferase n=1 Tax=Porphyridium purpureum TaxID=35688 RepID=A0A5J4YZH7_PORPP|nr:hypothetical protein FVE85_2168 [Porphyridium purpureum]|eukprot:POR7650..scf209_3